MRKQVLTALLFCLPNAGQADDRLRINLNDPSRMIHPQPMFDNVPIEPAFEDYAFMLFDLCDATNVECVIFPMMGEIENAVATTNPEGIPIIIYDRRLSDKIGYDGANAVIAHELGHHVCGHLTNPGSKTHYEIEKEADRFMGFAMKRLGVSLGSLLETYVRLGIDGSSATHPSFGERAKAIAEGYDASSWEELCQPVL